MFGISVHVLKFMLEVNKAFGKYNKLFEKINVFMEMQNEFNKKILEEVYYLKRPRKKEKVIKN